MTVSLSPLSSLGEKAGKIDVLICCASFEERSRVLAHNLAVENIGHVMLCYAQAEIYNVKSYSQAADSFYLFKIDSLGR